MKPTAVSCLLQVSAGLALLGVAGCIQLPPPTASVAVPSIPARDARVWFYRETGPYDSQDRPFIRMNEGVVATSEPNGAFYRDVPAGHYHVTVDSYAHDFNQTRDVDLAAGQQVYFKIVSLKDWISGGGQDMGTGYARPTFYVWSMPAAVAQGDVARSPFFGGG